MNFLMVIMISGIAHGCVCTTVAVAQHGGHTPNTRLTETCSLGLQFTSLILHVHVIINCQNKVSADQYPVTISWAQVYSLSRSHVFWKLIADQVLVFYWIAGSCQVNLLKTGQDCSEAC